MAGGLTAVGMGPTGSGTLLDPVEVSSFLNVALAVYPPAIATSPDPMAHWACDALRQPDCPDRAELQRLLDEAVGVPDGLASALDAFARDPSDEGWESLFRFTPPQSDYDWRQYVLDALVQRGMDCERLFTLASQDDSTSGLMDLVDSGKVDPRVVLARAWQSSETRSVWLGLAARAAFARGDEDRTSELLKEGLQRDVPPGLTRLHLLNIRGRASAAFNARLDGEGLPAGLEDGGA